MSSNGAHSCIRPGKKEEAVREMYKLDLHTAPHAVLAAVQQLLVKQDTSIEFMGHDMGKGRGV